MAGLGRVHDHYCAYAPAGHIARSSNEGQKNWEVQRARKANGDRGREVFGARCNFHLSTSPLVYDNGRIRPLVP